MERFKKYIVSLDEKITKTDNINEIIKKRKKLVSEFKKLSKYIHSDSIKKYNQALKYIEPSILEKIKSPSLFDINESNPGKKLANNTGTLISVTESLLFIPYYGKDEEKMIKSDYYNMCTAISYILYSKLKDEVTLENMKRAKIIKEGTTGQLIGGLSGVALGSTLGPAGSLIGLVFGVTYGHKSEEKLKEIWDNMKYSVSSKWNNINWEETAVNLGLIFGSIAGIFTVGGLSGFIGVGLLGGIVGAYIHDTLTESLKSIKTFDDKEIDKINENKFKDFLKSLKDVFKKSAKKITQKLNSKQKQLEKKLQQQYEIRENKIKRNLNSK